MCYALGIGFAYEGGIYPRRTLRAQRELLRPEYTSDAPTKLGIEGDSEPFETPFDRLRTGFDRLRTGFDRLRTGFDRLRTGFDRLRAGSDRLRAGSAQDRA